MSTNTEINTTTSNELIYFLSGLFIVIYTLYIRLILTRLPKELLFCTNGVNLKSCLFVIIGFLLNVVLLKKTINSLRRQEGSETLFKYITSQISDFISLALHTVYSKAVQLLNDPYNTAAVFCSKFYRFFGKRSETLFVFISLGIRLFIVIAFLFDVFVFFKFNYFYKALSLLCISMLIQAIFGILKDFSTNLEEAESYLIIEPQGIDPDTKLPITNYSLTQGNEDANLDYHVRQYILCNKLSGYLNMHQKYSNFFNPRVAIVIHSLYLIGWGYVIYKNILLFS